jgi:hypothetical protein
MGLELSGEDAMTEPQRHTLEEAIAYWQRRYETEPEPLKSFAREHLKGVLLLQDGQNGIVRGEAMSDKETRHEWQRVMVPSIVLLAWLAVIYAHRKRRGA